MQSALLAQVRRMRTLGRAWSAIYKNGRSSHSLETRREVKKFAADAVSRITKIQRQLNRNAFKFLPATGLEIRKAGKNRTRPIVVAPIESRIVQRAVHDVLLTVPLICEYAETPYSFGGVRRRTGTALAAVPAAIAAVLAAIESGAKYAIRRDISSFFTKIPKRTVTAIVADATNDPKLMELFEAAIAVELENLASLREGGAAFPIHEIGVAQGNSLSPLLGNMLLSEFDKEMNAGACRCIRYIDDFIVLAPDKNTAQSQLSRGIEILAKHGLEVCDETKKIFDGPVTQPFEFLGIEFANGAIRPSRESRNRLLSNISEVLRDSASAFRACGRSGTMIPSLCLVRTLQEVRGIVQGWGSHYSFCNEKNLLHQLDIKISGLIRQYIGAYSTSLKKADERGRRRLLGIALLEEFPVKPFIWPKPAPPISPAPPERRPALNWSPTEPQEPLRDDGRGAATT